MELVLSVVFLWIPLCFVAGYVGSKRTFGFWNAFLISLILSPIIGLIFAFASKSLEDEEYEYEVLKNQRKQQRYFEYALREKQEKTSNLSIADELEKLIKLKNSNDISEGEFHKLKDKLLNS